MTPICEYARPASLEAALALLGRTTPVTRPLGGGTYLALAGTQAETLVDLSGLSLSGVRHDAARLSIGAMTTLQEIVESAELWPEIRQAAEREAPINVRQRATVGGTVALGRSGPLLACLLALDAQVTVEPGTRNVSLDAYLNERRAGRMAGGLIVAVSFDARRRMGYAEIARTPADAPLMFVAAGAEITNGRLSKTQVACGGTQQPLVNGSEAVRRLDGLSTGEVVEAASAAGAEMQVAWADDIRGSVRYRRAMQPVLLRRALADLLATS